MRDYVHKFLDLTIGNIFGKDVTCREPIHRCDAYQPGVLVEFGRTGIKLFKKFLMPCGVCAAIPVLKQSKSKEDVVQVSNENPDKKLVRPSELPIYMFEKPAIRETPCKEHEEKPGVLEQSFGSVRKSLQDILKQFTGYTDKIINTIETGKAHSQVTLDYLREETNVMPRIGAVGLGGLTGLILGLRGGKFKKFVYSYTGAVVVASICYPKQAQEATVLAKYYVNVGYNFLYGVKPGEENQLEINWPELPKVPTNLSEVTDLASSTAGSAVSAVESKSDLKTHDATFVPEDTDETNIIDVVDSTEYETQTKNDKKKWFLYWKLL
ncbi:MICOS complex subunit MIC27 isoform X2 [Phymastichus coffea]|uniref:MICOS complex subunit MIC27 isoform X2 n=1 Tax=Phymastichus coffea TaxID=108790 RepID=UPI00273B461F|nr:MICOS complex subunit MIC27 isoform X2 [Phymastichus coffea]